MEHEPGLEYQTFCMPSESADEIAERYKEKLQEKQEHEMEREVTIVGPHQG
ncbi:MAG: hypothetical protein U5K69_00570 [Balneolaceae bacterium]|nr:hypothetical protein [Balneolaceae bacterium]